MTNSMQATLCKVIIYIKQPTKEWGDPYLTSVQMYYWDCMRVREEDYNECWTCMRLKRGAKFCCVWDFLRVVWGSVREVWELLWKNYENCWENYESCWEKSMRECSERSMWEREDGFTLWVVQITCEREKMFAILTDPRRTDLTTQPAHWWGKWPGTDWWEVTTLKIES